MKKVLIPKKSGGHRTIYVQDPVSCHHYRLAGYECQQLAAQGTHAGIMHGFTPGKNPVTNAMQHVNFRFTLCMDLADFFDSVDEKKMIAAGASPELAARCMYEGAARQGLSSSPAAANLAAQPMDADIVAALPPNSVYTRYADDLSISCDDSAALVALRDALPAIAERHGFKVKQSKTRLQDANFGRRCITGVMVDGNGCHIPRSTRRKLRAMQHRRPGSNKTRGLEEWSKLKTPSGQTIGTLQSAHIIESAKHVFAPAP